jgi:hypothetical protein
MIDHQQFHDRLRENLEGPKNGVIIFDELERPRNIILL